jgi:hypothetical protein
VRRESPTLRCWMRVPPGACTASLLRTRSSTARCCPTASSSTGRARRRRAAVRGRRAVRRLRPAPAASRCDDRRGRTADGVDQRAGGTRRRGRIDRAAGNRLPPRPLHLSGGVHRIGRGHDRRLKPLAGLSRAAVSGTAARGTERRADLPTPARDPEGGAPLSSRVDQSNAIKCLRVCSEDDAYGSGAGSCNRPSGIRRSRARRARFGDRPDDERLAALHVAGSEHAVEVRHPPRVVSAMPTHRRSAGCRRRR